MVAHSRHTILIGLVIVNNDPLADFRMEARFEPSVIAKSIALFLGVSILKRNHFGRGQLRFGVRSCD